MFHKILVAIDTSTASKSVFNKALELAATGSSLMLLHVLSPDEKGSPDVFTFAGMGYYPGLSGRALETYQEQWKTFEEHGLKLLRAYADEATAAGVAAEYTQNSGSPGRKICDLARTWGADLIVMGRRGHSGLSELFLGSVSNYVIHHAHCSVLTVQGQMQINCQVIPEGTVAV